MTERQQSSFPVELYHEYHVESSSEVVSIEAKDGKLEMTISHDPPRAFDRSLRVVERAAKGGPWSAVWTGTVDGKELVVEQSERKRFDKYVSPIVLNDRDMYDLVKGVEPMQLAQAHEALRDALSNDLPNRYPKGLPKGTQLVLRATLLRDGERLA